jgi:hypothetical protein
LIDWRLAIGDLKMPIVDWRLGGQRPTWLGPGETEKGFSYRIIVESLGQSLNPQSKITNRKSPIANPQSPIDQSTITNGQSTNLQSAVCNRK